LRGLWQRDARLSIGAQPVQECNRAGSARGLSFFYKLKFRHRRILRGRPEGLAAAMHEFSTMQGGAVRGAALLLAAPAFANDSQQSFFIESQARVPSWNWTESLQLGTKG